MIPDADILSAIGSEPIFSVHDVRQVIANVLPGAGWIKDEDASEAAALLIKRCAHRGWIRSRHPAYPGKWEITARFYLKPSSHLSDQ